MLDIDNFKSINDTKGHPAGDLVLMAIAGILKDIFAADGIVGRLGGDEFAVSFRVLIHRMHLPQGWNRYWNRSKA